MNVDRVWSRGPETGPVLCGWRDETGSPGFKAQVWITSVLIVSGLVLCSCGFECGLVELGPGLGLCLVPC